MEMDRRQYLPGNLEGPDVSIEISLKEYGLAWNCDNAHYNNGDVLFYYGIHFDDEKQDYTRFDFCSLPVNTNIKTEYAWADFEQLSSFIGGDFFELDFFAQIQTLLDYYGPENVFGSSYWNGLTYQQIMMNW